MKEMKMMKNKNNNNKKEKINNFDIFEAKKRI